MEILVLILFFAIIGMAVKHILKLDMCCIFIGFLFVSALFYVIASAFMAMKLPFIPLYYIFVVVFGLLLAASLGYIIKNKIYKEIELSFIKEQKIYIYAAFFVIIQIAAYIFLVHNDIDDSFYIARTNTILSTGMINTTEPSTGLSGFFIQGQYAMVGYEVFVSCLCKLLGTNAAVMYHGRLAVVIYIVAVVVIYDLTRILFEKKSGIAMITVMFMNVFAGYSVYSEGSFINTRAWQGKTLIIGVVLPSLLYVMIGVFKKNAVKMKDILLLLMVLLCGLFSSTVGLFLLPISYGLLTISYVIYLAINQKMKPKDIITQFIKICIPILCILPFVGIGFYRIKTGYTMNSITENVDGLDYLGVLKDYNGTGIILILLLVSIIIHLVAAGDYKKYIFGVYPVICFATILNPLVCKMVAAYITGVPVYWRLLWILFINYNVTALIIFVISLGEIKIRKTVIRNAVNVLIIFMLVFRLSNSVYSIDNFQLAHNAEKIDDTSKQIADSMLASSDTDKNLLVPEEKSYYIRQYTGDINLVWSRYSADLYNSVGLLDLFYMTYDNIYNKRTIDADTFKLMEGFSVNCVAVYKDTDIDRDVLDKMVKIKDIDDFILYKLGGEN